MSNNNITSLNEDKIKVISETEFSFNSSYLTLGKHRFHYTWLRDYCLCKDCRHMGSSQRLFDISDLNNPPKPLSVDKEADTITIQWEEKPPHKSVFSVSWLLSRANNLDIPTTFPQKRLWDKSDLDIHPPQRHSIDKVSEEIWQKELLERGFTILCDLAFDRLENFLSSLGKLYPTEYGQTCTIKKNPNPKNVATDSDYMLPLHTDLRFASGHRLIVGQYCVENKAKGGESILVDGFKVAEDFRNNHPYYYKLLSEIPVYYRNFDAEMQYFFQHKTPILKLDKDGNLSDIYFGPHNCDRDHIALDIISDYYEAYCAFYRELKNPNYQYIFRLERGQILLMQNFRMIHGRMPFNASSGFRHVEVGYADWDHFIARQNFHKVKHIYLNK